jgi:hypothetical protein
MSSESLGNNERIEHITPRFLNPDEKTRYKEQVIGILREYPGNFFTGIFEEYAERDYDTKEVAVATNGDTVVGCLFFDASSHECDWLAISKKIPGSKKEIAKKLFQTVFDSVPKGTRVFWYINTEDAIFEGKSVGEDFERGRALYKEMGTLFTRVENKFGEGNHAYLVEYTT